MTGAKRYMHELRALTDLRPHIVAEPEPDNVRRIHVLLMYMPVVSSSRRRHTSWTCDWSSDVCSSDLSLRRDPRVVAVIGHLTSAPTIAAAGIYNSGSNPVVELSPSASSPDLSGIGPYTFRVCATDL